MSTDHPSLSARRRDRRRGYGWLVTVDAAGVGDADLDEKARDLADRLQPYGGAVSVRRNPTMYCATFSLGEPDLDAASAMTLGIGLFLEFAAAAELPDYPIVHAEISRIADQPALKIVR